MHAKADQAQALEDALLVVRAVRHPTDDADQPILEPELGTTPVWDETAIIGLFEANQDSEALKAALKANYGELPPF